MQVPEAADTLGELAGRWRLAEQRLYPIILADPAGYQRCLLAVRRLADELVAVTTPAALVAAFAGAQPRAAAALRAVGGAGDAGSAELVAGAAFALRQRELAAAQAASERATRIADAARTGASWVVVAEAGERAMAAFGHYRRLEMHLPDGMGIDAYAEPQADRAAPVFVVERVPLDPASGAALSEPAQRWSFEDLEAWAAAAAALRDAVDQGASSVLTRASGPGEDARR